MPDLHKIFSGVNIDEQMLEGYLATSLSILRRLHIMDVPLNIGWHEDLHSTFSGIVFSCMSGRPWTLSGGASHPIIDKQFLSANPPEVRTDAWGILAPYFRLPQDWQAPKNKYSGSGFFFLMDDGRPAFSRSDATL